MEDLRVEITELEVEGAEGRGPRGSWARKRRLEGNDRNGGFEANGGCTGSCREQSLCESESGQRAPSATSSPLTHLKTPHSTRSMIGWTAPCPSRQRPTPIFFLRLSQWRLCELRRAGFALAPDSARTAAFRSRRVAYDKPVDFLTGPADADAATPLRRASLGSRWSSRGAASQAAPVLAPRCAHTAASSFWELGDSDNKGVLGLGPRRRMQPSRCAALLSAVGARSDAASWRPRLRRRALPRVRDAIIRRSARYFSPFASSLVRPALRACVAALLAHCACAAARSAVPLALAAASAMIPS